MLNALDHWGADARGKWMGADAALGHLLLKTTPQSIGEALPAQDTSSATVITGDLRLDNRAELGQKLGIVAADLGGWSDGRLVLRAYETWGHQCPGYLLGDFAFAIWDARSRRLFCARDQIGVKPFYYHHRGDTLAFATEMKGLLALPFVERGINETWIGDYFHRVPLERTATFYAAISRLQAAHTLTFDADGLHITRYWAADAGREVRFARDSDYIDAFREKLELAIRRRVDTPFEVGAELSGGLDSSGICAIAQHELRVRGRELQTFSQVRAAGMEDARGLPPDYRWAVESLCRHAGITRAHFLDGQGGILEALDWANAHHDEPSADASSFYNHGLYEAAAANGVRILLSGFAGNLCVSAEATGRRRELLRAGAWSELWRELSSIAGPRHPFLRWLRLAAAELETPTIRALFDSLAHHRSHAALPTTDGFTRRTGMRRRRFRLARAAHSRGSVRESAIRLLEWPGVPLRLEHANLAAAGRRLEYRYPLLDLELIALYLAMPSRLKLWRGTGRYVFRQSLQGWVPDDVRLASGPRGSANPGNLARKIRDQDALKARLRALAPDNPIFQYVDLGKLITPPPRRHRFPRERHTAMVMALALEHSLRTARATPDGNSR